MFCLALLVGRAIACKAGTSPGEKECRTNKSRAERVQSRAERAASPSVLTVLQSHRRGKNT
eukprot:3093613-Amphidinium_carterae.1